MSNAVNDGVDTLALANKITKALYPDIYGKPGISMKQAAVLMGTRGIIEDVLKTEISTAQSPEQTNASAAAIGYALNLEDEDDTVQFLRMWSEGEFDELRNLYPDVPAAVFIGAEVGYEPVTLVQDGGGA